MAYSVKLSKKDIYWSGNPESVWVDDLEKAEKFSTKKAGEKAIKEISENWPYSLELISD